MVIVLLSLATHAAASLFRTPPDNPSHAGSFLTRRRFAAPPSPLNLRHPSLPLALPVNATMPQHHHHAARRQHHKRTSKVAPAAPPAALVEHAARRHRHVAHKHGHSHLKGRSMDRPSAGHSRFAQLHGHRDGDGPGADQHAGESGQSQQGDSGIRYSMDEDMNTQNESQGEAPEYTMPHDAAGKASSQAEGPLSAEEESVRSDESEVKKPLEEIFKLDPGHALIANLGLVRGKGDKKLEDVSGPGLGGKTEADLKNTTGHRPSWEIEAELQKTTGHLPESTSGREIPEEGIPSEQEISGEDIGNTEENARGNLEEGERIPIDKRGGGGEKDVEGTQGHAPAHGFQSDRESAPEDVSEHGLTLSESEGEKVLESEEEAVARENVLTRTEGHKPAPLATVTSGEETEAGETEKELQETRGHGVPSEKEQVTGLGPSKKPEADLNKTTGHRPSWETEAALQKTTGHLPTHGDSTSEGEVPGVNIPSESQTSGEDTASTAEEETRGKLEGGEWIPIHKGEEEEKDVEPTEGHGPAHGLPSGGESSLEDGPEDDLTLSGSGRETELESGEEAAGGENILTRTEGHEPAPLANGASEDETEAEEREKPLERTEGRRPPKFPRPAGAAKKMGEEAVSGESAVESVDKESVQERPETENRGKTSEEVTGETGSVMEELRAYQPEPGVTSAEETRKAEWKDEEYIPRSRKDQGDQGVSGTERGTLETEEPGKAEEPSLSSEGAVKPEAETKKLEESQAEVSEGEPAEEKITQEGNEPIEEEVTEGMSEHEVAQVTTGEGGGEEQEEEEEEAAIDKNVIRAVNGSEVIGEDRESTQEEVAERQTNEPEVATEEEDTEEEEEGISRSEVTQKEEDKGSTVEEVAEERKTKPEETGEELSQEEKGDTTELGVAEEDRKHAAKESGTSDVGQTAISEDVDQTVTETDESTREKLEDERLNGQVSDEGAGPAMEEPGAHEPEPGVTRAEERRKAKWEDEEYIPGLSKGEGEVAAEEEEEMIQPVSEEETAEEHPTHPPKKEEEVKEKVKPIPRQKPHPPTGAPGAAEERKLPGPPPNARPCSGKPWVDGIGPPGPARSLSGIRR